MALNYVEFLLEELLAAATGRFVMDIRAEFADEQPKPDVSAEITPPETP